MTWQARFQEFLRASGFVPSGKPAPVASGESYVLRYRGRVGGRVVGFDRPVSAASWSAAFDTACRVKAAGDGGELLAVSVCARRPGPVAYPARSVRQVLPVGYSTSSAGRVVGRSVAVSRLAVCTPSVRRLPVSLWSVYSPADVRRILAWRRFDSRRAA